MTFNNGEYQGDSVEEILDTMVSNAKQYWDEDIKDDQLSTFRLFYRPIAELLAKTQQDIGLVLESTQIDNATGDGLGLLTALIGVGRIQAIKSEGTVTFSRDSSASQDYIIPKGTEVQTQSNDPEKYSTVEQATLTSGSTSVDVDVIAVEAGVDGNTAAGTVTVMPDPPTGIESVTNTNSISGGSDQEDDSELRTRAKDELAKGSRASTPAILNNVLDVTDVSDAVVYVNDTNTDNTGSGGLPDHSFEAVVQGGADSDIAQRIFETKAAGDTSYGGANGSFASGSATMANGQSFTIDFSRPASVQIYIDIALDVTSEFSGADDVIDNIIDYIGGIYSSGLETKGMLRVGKDVIYGEVEYAIRNTPGVYDVTNLEIGTSAGPTGTSNIAIADSDLAIADGTDGSITISTTQV
jgi:uncharacterized phage protein gp47/JayE